MRQRLKKRNHIILFISCVLSAFLIVPLTVNAQNKSPTVPADHWKGTINIPGKKLSFQTHFEQEKDSLSGSITIQGTSLPLEDVVVTPSDSIFFSFTTSINVAKFKGAFASDSIITGQFQQAGYSFPFNMRPYKADSLSSQQAAAPSQTTLPPYHRKDLIIKNDSIEIGGTLTWPKDKKAGQLVIMISGSGAQNRDEEILGFKPFFQIADSLTRIGIATFRYDDRGMGKSIGNFAQTSLDMLASDVEAIITEFTDGSGQNFDEIILLGHSQGGIVGGKVAAQNKRVDKLILMASPGVSLAQNVVKQVELLNEQKNIPDSVITQNVSIQKSIFDTLRGTQNFTKIKEVLIQDYIRNYNANPDNSNTSLSNPEQFFRSKVKQELQYIQAPAYLSFLDYDPTNDLQKLDIPVLVLFGGKDTQVPVGLNKAPIEKALNEAEVKYKIDVLKNANHLFQHAQTGAASEYGKLENVFVDTFLQTIKHWIKKDY